MVTAEELLASGAMATVHRVTPTASSSNLDRVTMSYLRADIRGKKTPKCKEKKATQLGQKKPRNSCPTEPMAARDNGGKNECVFSCLVSPPVG